MSGAQSGGARSDAAGTTHDFRHAFRRAIDGFASHPKLILAHNDADGLSSAAILSRALQQTGEMVHVRIVGRGENPWSDEMKLELAGKAVGGLILADLGVRNGVPREGTPTIILDHHVPQGAAPYATVISGYGMDPIPTSSLLAWRCVSAFANSERLLWLAALGIVGDLAEGAGFPEMHQARARYGITALRACATLINQPRRSSSGDASAALALLMKADHPREILSGEHAETAQLIAAREEVKRELERVRRAAPKVVGGVAMIRFASPCQIHPLIAQMWIGRLKGLIVIAANAGFRPGWVHFAARSAADIDLIAFLREHAPAEVDAAYGGGHRKASGGALRIAQWNTFVHTLGFGSAMEIAQ